MDLNHASRTEGAIIASIEFNPKYHMALVAGFSSTVVGAASLFKVRKLLNVNNVCFHLVYYGAIVLLMVNAAQLPNLCSLIIED